MADSVLAIQKGFEFQAKYFWYKACSLYRPGSTAVEITYEADGIPGFDDITLAFDPPRLSTYGYPVSRECYQVKFHVDHSRAFDVTALTDPSFIGATSESLLQKLHKNYKMSPEEYSKTNYYIINTWGVDRKDLLNRLIDNQGAIIFKRLFDGTTDQSKMGRVRKSWRDHLGLSVDTELKTVLRQLRIRANASSGEMFDEPLSYALAAINLKPLSDDRRTNPYTSLIVRLHEEKTNKLDKHNLHTILQQEDLWVTTTTSENLSRSIGVRTFRKGAENLEAETDHLLCLLRHFESRHILDDSLWQNKVLPAMSKFAEEVIRLGKPLTIHLDTHTSTTFALGYFIGNKSGSDISIIQKSPKGGRSLWRPDKAKVNSEDQWIFSEDIIDSNGTDLAIALSLSNDVSEATMQYLSAQPTGVFKILHARPKSGCGFNAITDANHILEYILQLNNKIRSWKTVNSPTAKLHLFISAPNAFTFFLGEHASGYGRIALYEYDFEGLRSGTYVPSLNLPL